jgi:hypothetical protein
MLALGGALRRDGLAHEGRGSTSFARGEFAQLLALARSHTNVQLLLASFPFGRRHRCTPRRAFWSYTQFNQLSSQCIEYDGGRYYQIRPLCRLISQVKRSPNEVAIETGTPHNFGHIETRRREVANTSGALCFPIVAGFDGATPYLTFREVANILMQEIPRQFGEGSHKEGV